MRENMETPVPEDLIEAPELAVVAVLAAALRMMRWSLLAGHPAALGPAGHVHQIMRLTLLLHRALLAYSEAIPHARTPQADDDVPF